MTDFDARAKDWDADRTRADRASAVARGIAAQVPLSPGMRGLEYGCGTGLLSFALRPHLGPLTLADSSTGMLAVLREKIALEGIDQMQPMQLDLTTDPLPAERYDLIYTQMTLHHVPDTGRILRQFRHLLEPGGYLCIADLDEEDGSFHGAGFAGHNGFDRDHLASLARDAGFEDVRFETVFQIQRGKTGYPVFLMVAR